MRNLVSLAALLLSSPAMAVCPFTSSVLTTPTVVTGDITNAADTVELDCSPGAHADAVYEFVAPNDARYTFSLAGSDYDTFLGVIDADDCATTLECNDDTNDLTSEIVLDMAAGETIALVIEGFAGAEGMFNLEITEAFQVCDFDADLGGALGTGVAAGTTCGAGDEVWDASCATAQGSEDHTVQWTAPADGTYTFSTVGSDFDTMLLVTDGSCTELACNDDNFAARTSGITVDMLAGETSWFTIDSYGSGCGAYVLNVHDNACPDADGDAVCDSIDLCVGYDPNGDDDGDAVCNELDGCLGDDNTGDADFDGICNDFDFVLSQTPAVAGGQMTFTASNALPGSRVFFLVSPRLGIETCHPVVSSVCTPLNRPIVVGSSTADSAGFAGITITVPNVPSGTEVWSQAAWFSGAGGDVSQREFTTVP